jgi:putative membrane protein
MNRIKSNPSYRRFIIIVSVVIPVVVALLLFIPMKFSVDSDSWIKSLPFLNATLNFSTSVFLVLALIAIKTKRIAFHRNLMTLSLFLGVLFLVSYVIYHASSDSTIFGDADHDGVLSMAEKDAVATMRTYYLATLLSHIALSIVVVPFVLFAFYYALTDQIDRHRKIVKFTFPIWLYVSITGVLVYLMISPYYP